MPIPRPTRRAVKRIDTHAASVFSPATRLQGQARRALPFLDYSTLEKRKAACEAELEVNRPFAPEIYRRVVPITREDGGRLALGGAGDAGRMGGRDAPLRRERDARPSGGAGKIDAALADALGRAVAAGARARAERSKPEPWIEALARLHRAERRGVSRGAGAVSRCARPRRSRARAAPRYARMRPLLRERGGAGLVRRIHGDLHLGNIVLIDGRPVLFDAIEFGPLIASGDVLYDLAFLLMDLIERGLKPAANIVLNRYLAETRRTEDLDALAALPLFLSMRAAIRAKVTAARLDQPHPTERAAIAQQRAHIFRLRLRRFIAPPPPRAGRGRRPVRHRQIGARARAGAELAPAPGAVVLRSDVERKALFGKDEAERLPPDAYTPRSDGAGLCNPRRQGAPRGRRRPFGHRRCGVRQPDRSAPLHASSPPQCFGVAFHGFSSSADLADAPRARRSARGRDASDADAAVARGRRATTSARSTGRASMPPARRTRRSRAAPRGDKRA